MSTVEGPSESPSPEPSGPIPPAPPEVQPAPTRRRRWARWILVGVLVLGLETAALTFAGLPDADSLAKENPKTTALIEQRATEAREAGRKPRRRQQWVPLSAVSKPAVDAVLISEDASFYLHDGVDTVELARAVGQAVEKG
ncbi:transglycosylase domain-containing protein, partial [Corallococcus exiguus]